MIVFVVRGEIFGLGGEVLYVMELWGSSIYYYGINHNDESYKIWYR